MPSYTITKALMATLLLVTSQASALKSGRLQGAMLAPFRNEWSADATDSQSTNPPYHELEFGITPCTGYPTNCQRRTRRRDLRQRDLRPQRAEHGATQTKTLCPGDGTTSRFRQTARGTLRGARDPAAGLRAALQEARDENNTHRLARAELQRLITTHLANFQKEEIKRQQVEERLAKRTATTKKLHELAVRHATNFRKEETQRKGAEALVESLQQQIAELKNEENEQIAWNEYQDAQDATNGRIYALQQSYSALQDDLHRTIGNFPSNYPQQEDVKIATGNYLDLEPSLAPFLTTEEDVEIDGDTSWMPPPTRQYSWTPKIAPIHTEEDVEIDGELMRIVNMPPPMHQYWAPSIAPTTEE